MQQDISSTKAPQHTGLARFMDACHLRQPDATPIWFMRQAGRCLTEYRELLAKYDVLTMARTPELCTRISLLPVEKLGVDAAVLYADIMLPVQGMGVELEIKPIGPIIHHPIRNMQDVEALRVVSPEEGTPFVLEATRMVRSALADRQAIIGFCGGPFTLAGYLIEGAPSRDYFYAKALMYGQSAVWHALMEKLTVVMSDYVVAQVRAGANAIQLFDSWVGTLSPSAYKEYVFPYAKRILDAVKSETGAPTIHFGTGNATILDLMVEAGGDVMCIDSRYELDEAWARIGYGRGIQGNMDATRLLAGWEATEVGMRDVLRRANNRPGHIFNLGHGVAGQTDPDLLRRLVDTVHTETAR